MSQVFISRAKMVEIFLIFNYYRFKMTVERSADPLYITKMNKKNSILKSLDFWCLKFLRVRKLRFKSKYLKKISGCNVK